MMTFDTTLMEQVQKLYEGHQQIDIEMEKSYVGLLAFRTPPNCKSRNACAS